MEIFFNMEIYLEQFGAALCLFQEHFLDLRLPSRGLRRKSPAGWNKVFVASASWRTLRGVLRGFKMKDLDSSDFRKSLCD